MALTFTKTVPRWEGVTSEPPEAKKTEGFIAGDRPPAQWENFQRKALYEVITENREVLDDIDDELIEINNKIDTPSSYTTVLDKDSQSQTYTDAVVGTAVLNEVSGVSVYQVIIGGENVASLGTKSFTTVNGTVYYDWCNNVLFTGDGLTKVITNLSGITRHIMVFPITGTPQSAYTAAQLQNLIGGQYFEGLKSTQEVAVETRDGLSNLLSTQAIKCHNESKFALSQVPNLTKNTIKSVNGERVATKRNENYVLQSGDVTAIDNTTFTNVVIALIQLGVLASLGTPTIIDGKVIIANRTEITSTLADNVAQIGNFYYGDTRVRVLFPLGTSLEEARADLANTPIIYQLATPQTKSEQDFPDWEIEITGSLKSGDGTIEVVAYDYDLLGEVKVDYPRNISQSVSNNTDGIKSLELQVEAKANKVQEDYIAPTFINGWVHSYPANSGYYKNEFNEVFINFVANGGIATLNTTLFTLGEDYTPSAVTPISGVRLADGTSTNLMIQPSGAVLIGQNNGMGMFSFCGSYRVV